jgi:hypothetical protein
VVLGWLLSLEDGVFAAHTEDAFVVVVSMVVPASVGCCRSVLMFVKL